MPANSLYRRLSKICKANTEVIAPYTFTPFCKVLIKDQDAGITLGTMVYSNPMMTIYNNYGIQVEDFIFCLERNTAASGAYTQDEWGIGCFRTRNNGIPFHMLLTSADVPSMEGAPQEELFVMIILQNLSEEIIRHKLPNYKLEEGIFMSLACL